MHFVRPTDSPYILIIASCKPFEPLVNDHIMYNKISKTVGHNTKTDRLHPPYLFKCAKRDKQDTGYCKNHKEGVVLFKKARLNPVMILVEHPKKSVHHIPVGKPCDTFHNNKGAQ
jgi:hypothetical protein